MRFVEQRFGKVGLFVGALLAFLVTGMLFSPSAHALGEYYQYIKGNDTIRVTGGILTTPAGLTRTGENTFQGGITVRGDVARIPDGNAATLTRPCQYTLIVEDIVGDLTQPGDATPPPDSAHRAEADLKNNVHAETGDDNNDWGCKAGDIIINGGVDLVITHLTRAILIHNVTDPRGDAGGQACPGSNAPVGTDCNTIPDGCPGSPRPGTPTGPCPFQTVAPTEEAAEPDPCPISKDTELRWMACPVVELAAWMTEGLDNFIDAYMLTGNEVFQDKNSDFKEASDIFRNFAIGLLIISGIIMVIAEALGLSFLDAYTLRKVLPRLIFAILAISVWWPMAYFLVGFFDALGIAMGDIIYSSFQVEPGSINITKLFMINVGMLAGVAAGGFALGPAGIVSLLGSLLIALAVGAGVLIVRQAIIIACILLGPLFIAMFVLENLKSYANFWWGTFIKMLLLFPVATGAVALCKVLGNIMMTSGKPFATLVAIIFWFVGYILFPALFRLVGGMVATIGGIADDRSRGLRDRNQKFRQNKRSERYNSAKEGRGGYVGAEMAGRVYRRTTMGGLTPTRRGQAAYRAATKQTYRNAADAAIKNDNGFSSGNDDATAVAIHANTKAEFERDYIARAMAGGATQQAATRQARDAMAELETGMGASIGSDTMKLAAYKAKNASNKGYDHKNSIDNLREAADDGASLINAGVINASDAAAIFKSNQNRSDHAGVGFGAAMGMFETAAERQRAGIHGSGLVTTAEGAALNDDVLDGSNPGAIIQGRHEAVTALSPRMLQRVESANTTAASTGDPHTLDRELASLAGLYDEMARTSPMKAKIMADNVLSRKVTDDTYGRTVFEVDGSGNKIADGKGGFKTKTIKGEKVTVRELMERARQRQPNARTGEQSFLDMRREYGSRLAAETLGTRDDYTLGA